MPDKFYYWSILQCKCLLLRSLEDEITSISAVEILFRVDERDLPCFSSSNLFIHCPLTFNIAAIVNFSRTRPVEFLEHYANGRQSDRVLARVNSDQSEMDRIVRDIREILQLFVLSRVIKTRVSLAENKFTSVHDDCAKSLLCDSTCYRNSL